MNVRINLSGLKDESVRTSLGQKMEQTLRGCEGEFARIRAIVESKLG
jgi:formiminotetrahydrofolate cyclodeaminase